MQADAALCTRDKRPENGTDEQPCLSDVYKNSTRAKRRQADVPLCGRSMVEMLGVLAIIGVLSVGAMTGYSKAMFKYKLNKQTEQIGSILDMVQTYDDMWNNQKDSFSSMYYLIPFLRKLDIIPAEMINPDDERFIYDPFNNKINISVHQPNEENSLFYYELNYYLDSNLDICTNLVQSAKLRSAYLDSITFCQSRKCNYYYYGDNVKNDSTTVKKLKNMKLDDMREACASCAGVTGCYLAIIWGRGK